ncbi:hypothetical protein [Methylobacterium soli]|nr:hypothetical protein [Methylobacterium soli]GJE46351.1 hypothetical protein AEGHOMDF_5554 [Methylobacterium soli]
MTMSTRRPHRGRILAAALALAGGLIVAAPRAEAAPFQPSAAIADSAETGIIAVRGGHGWGHHHHHHRGWGHRHHGWGHRHHGWGHRHHGWGHRHHHRHYRW